VYVPPAAGASVLRAFDAALNHTGSISLSEGGLAAGGFQLGLQITPENKAITASPNPNGVKVTIDPATGTFTGTFTHPVSKLATPFNGVLLQNAQSAVGYFQGSISRAGGTLQSGRVQISAPVPPPLAP
jgi:hypothetical protein